jgi:hypothetical protein
MYASSLASCPVALDRFANHPCRLMSDYEVTLVNDNSMLDSKLACQVNL